MVIISLFKTYILLIKYHCYHFIYDTFPVACCKFDFPDTIKSFLTLTESVLNVAITGVRSLGYQGGASMSLKCLLSGIFGDTYGKDTIQGVISEVWIKGRDRLSDMQVRWCSNRFTL